MSSTTAEFLIANGIDDTVNPIANQQLLAKLLPRARTLAYPDAGHGLLFQPSTHFVDEIEDFLQRSAFEVVVGGAVYH